MTEQQEPSARDFVRKEQHHCSNCPDDDLDLGSFGEEVGEFIMVSPSEMESLEQKWKEQGRAEILHTFKRAVMPFEAANGRSVRVIHAKRVDALLDGAEMLDLTDEQRAWMEEGARLALESLLERAEYHGAMVSIGQLRYRLDNRDYGFPVDER